VPLPDGSRLTLATSSYRTANSIDMAAKGVAPDQVINADWDSYTLATDPILNAGLALLAIQ
jgi:C-terminal processing protease CtpA/Prc